MIIVALPVWLAHEFLLRRAAANQSDETGSTLRKLYVHGALFLTTLYAAFGSIQIIEQLAGDIRWPRTHRRPHSRRRSLVLPMATRKPRRPAKPAAPRPSSDGASTASASSSSPPPSPQPTGSSLPLPMLFTNLLPGHRTLYWALRTLETPYAPPPHGRLSAPSPGPSSGRPSPPATKNQFCGRSISTDSPSSEAQHSPSGARARPSTSSSPNSSARTIPPRPPPTSDNSYCPPSAFSWDWPSSPTTGQ